MSIGLFRDSGDCIGLALITLSAADYKQALNLKVVVSAGSTAATTFKVRWGGYGGSTAYLLRDFTTAAIWGVADIACMTVMEIAQ